MGLTEAVAEYHVSGEGYDSLVCQVAERVYNFPAGRLGCTDDDRAAFLLHFYQRIPGMIERFESCGKPFEAYLNVSLGYQLRTYRRNKIRCSRYTTLAERVEAKAEGSRTDRTEFDADAFLSRLYSFRRIRRDAMAKRLVFLALKLSFHLSDEDIGEIALAAGVSAEILVRRAQEIRGRIEARCRRRESLRRRADRTFLEIRVAEEDLGQAVDATSRAEILTRIQHLHRRLSRARAAHARVTTIAGNKEVAQTLGVPKGTVDSGMHHLKQYLQAMAGSQNEPSAVS